MIRNKALAPDYPTQVPTAPIERATFAIVDIAVAAELSDNKA